MRARALFAGLILVCGVHGVARAQSVSVVDPECLPSKGNGVVRAAVIPDPAVGQSPRLYFRWRGGQQAFYWVPLEVEPGGKYWTILPRPEERNHEVELYAAVVDAAGKVIAQSETELAGVRSDCKVQLNPKEQGLAENLTIGETAQNQYKKKVLGFLCPGVKIRINHQDVRRADDECGPCGLAWLPPALAGAGALAVALTGSEPEPEASPSRP